MVPLGSSADRRRPSRIGQDFVYLIRKCRDDVSEEGCAFHFPGVLVELDVGELRDPIDGQEHDQLAVGVAELAAIDVDVADLVGLEPLALLLGLLDPSREMP